MDEDSSLAKSFKFNKLIRENNIQIEIIAGNILKLCKMIERSNEEYYIEIRIVLRLQKKYKRNYSA